jgi:hypothetical protein
VEGWKNGSVEWQATIVVFADLALIEHPKQNWSSTAILASFHPASLPSFPSSLPCRSLPIVEDHCRSFPLTIVPIHSLIAFCAEDCPIS